MPFVFVYLLKLSISLAIVFLFYQFVLRRLTFYNWNRWYLVAYSLMSFVIPFIDITPVLQENQWTNAGVVEWVPVIGNENNISPVSTAGYHFSTWNLISILLVTGMLVLFMRLIIQLVSVRKMMRNAKPVHAEGMNLYQVEGDIIPFSFGKSIFINRNLHTDEEFREIISHEFVHVKQRHSLDIIWGELLCLFNWYNPFAWLIRRSIRQNLEFIADHKVLEYGIDPKQYQYLLLKVIGNNKFSIAPKFNFSSLKKRIAMMNKMKSAGVHIVKFLFILPLVAVLLIAFRNNDAQQGDVNSKFSPESKFFNYLISDFKKRMVADTVPMVRTPNSKGYLVNIIGVEGNCTVVVTDKTGKEVERLLLTEWDKDANKYENKYGEILPPPPALEYAIAGGPIALTEPIVSLAVSPVAVEGVATMPGSGIETTVAIAPAISLSPIKTTVGDLIPCYTSYKDTTPAPSVVSGYNLKNIATEWEITNNKATMKLKDGSTEVYDLKNPDEKKKFEKKFGKIYEVATVTGSGYTPVAVAGSDYTEVIETKPGYTPVAIAGRSGKATVHAYTPSPSKGVLIIDETGHAITGEEDVIVTITKNTSREQLEDLKKQMKAKGVELEFDDVEYSNGKLISISGTMKANESRSNFSASDFEKLILAMVKKDGKTWFKVGTNDNKEVI